MTDKTLADDLRGISMGWVWALVFFIVVAFGGILTPWKAIENLLSNQGVGDKETELLAFVAGYTLPLTAGFCLIAFLYLVGAQRGRGWQAQVFVATAILAGFGILSSAFGIGLAPDYRGWYNVSGPGTLRIVFIVFGAYFNSYGLPLVICSLALGAGAAIQAERWVHTARLPARPQSPFVLK